MKKQIINAIKQRITKFSISVNGIVNTKYPNFVIPKTM